MKKNLNLFLLCLFMQPVIAQYAKPAEARYIYHEWSLPHVSHERIKAHQIAFGYISLIDNRLDSNQFLMTSKAALGPELQLWRLPESSKIKKWLEQFLDREIGKKDTLFISLRCFQFGKILDTKPCFFFKTDAFVKRPGGFQKLVSIDHCYDLNRGYHSLMMIALNDLLSLISHSAIYNTKNRVYDSTIYTKDKLRENIHTSWVSFPIYQEDTMQTGFYRSFKSFRNASPEKCPDLSVCQLEDSSYQLYDKDGNRWLDKLFPNGYPYWGICLNGIRYLNIGSGRFIPLQRKGLDFEWRLPNSIPQMPKILLKGLYAGNAGGGSPDLSGVQIKDGKEALVLFAVFVGIGICVLIVEGIHETVVDSKNYKMEQQGIVPSNPNYRNGIIDMDTGNIVFH